MEKETANPQTQRRMPDIQYFREDCWIGDFIKNRSRIVGGDSEAGRAVQKTARDDRMINEFDKLGSFR
jgi:hypothetical protein